MSRETSNTEQLSWEQQLSSAVDERVDGLVRSGVKPAKNWKSAFGFVAQDGTRMDLLRHLPWIIQGYMYRHGRYYSRARLMKESSRLYHTAPACLCYVTDCSLCLFQVYP
jgi:hypothetical protein